jgi:CheY-like chemotaxis protein
MTAPHLDGAPVVLVVDDEPVVLKLMERTLLAAGYVVHTASGALPAHLLLYSLGTPPAAVVTDLRMTPIDGAGLAKMIHAQWPGIPVLFVTGYAPAAQYRHLPGPVLTKPFDPEDLTEAVSRLIRDPSAERLSS